MNKYFLAFIPGDDFESVEKCISRLEVSIPPLILMLNNGIKIKERMLISVYNDSLFLFNEDGELDISNIFDENLRQRARAIIPDLRSILT